MKTIKKNIKVDNIERTLYKRNSKACIYAYVDGKHWDVMKIQTVKSYFKREFPNGVVMECNVGDEFLPSSKQWGVNGWTYMNLEAAEKKFEEIS